MSKWVPNFQLGLPGVVCAIGFLINIILIVATEPPGSIAVTPLKMLVLMWVAVGNECFKMTTGEEAET